MGSQSYTSSNRCVSFEWNLVWRMIQNCGVAGKFLLQVREFRGVFSC